MATASQWLLFACLGFCAAWMDERPVLESRDGNLFISAAKDKNITLKILGDGQVNVNDINLLRVATAAESATHLIERWRTGYLAQVESNLHRLTQIVEGPEGLEKRIAMMKGFGDGNNTLQPETSARNQSTTGMNSKIRMIAHRVRRVEEKVRSIESKLRINECTSNPCQNGGSCQDLYEGYQCHCPSNWEGPNCVTDVNECVRLLGTDLGCQNGATCLNLPGSYRCECAPGWFGLHCNKKSPICNTQNSDELCGHGVCVAKPGTPLGYTCICDQGWQADSPNPACIKDVDECAGNHRPCSVHPWVACRNAPGTFFCDSCPQGYTGNGYYCIDIDECLVDNGGCSTSPRVQCINTMGSRMCGPCPTGYQGDGVTCTYVGSCAINNGGCHPLAACVKTLPSNFVMCRCPMGMAGDGIGPNGCQPSTDVSVSALCSSNPCVNGRCIDIGDGYTCVCNPGYTGVTCNVKMNPCTPNPCKNNGVCVIANGEATCDCRTAYTGSRCETPRQTCGGVSRNPVGHLEFPIGGSVYQKGLSCAWVLVTNSSLVLNVTFTRFNLEQSTDCKFDFLQIHDGRNAGSQMIGRFCGNTFPHETGNIVSSHNSLYFWFHSDDSVNNDGFAFHWNSIKPVCGGSLTDDYGTISSPGSPGRYPPNRDCYWRITVSPSKRIQIHFGLLMLEEHPTCQSDFLEISTIHQERLGLYCNHTHPPPLVVPASEAIIYFHSDSAGQDAGFQIHYSAIEGIPGCNGVYTASTGTISNPAHLDLENIVECEWKIQMPIGKRVEATWFQFDLSQSDCKSEHIEVYDGDTSESPLLGRFCGNTIPPTVRSSNNIMTVVFKSKKVFKGSFAFSYKVVCGSIFSEETGVIQSPEYPRQRMNIIEDCVYEIKQPADKRIVLRILDLDFRVANSPNCYLSYFRVFDSPRENATRLANLCITDNDLSPDSLVYYSTHNYMMIKYKSIGGRGFLANYTTIANKCGGLYTENSKTIQVPTTNNHYLNNLDCVWTIQAPAGYVIQLTWLEFELEGRCRRDYVKVYENYMTTGREELGTFCELHKPPMILTQGNELTLTFHSDSSITREGFTASYVFIDAKKSCGGRFIKKVGILQSPNYPLNYPNKRQCEWVIEAPNWQRVILNVQDFKMEHHSMCSFDYLEIRNGGYATSPLIGKYCGRNIPKEIISQTNQMYLKFVTDEIKSARGFSIAWDSTTIGCGGTLTAANGDIISPNYPQSYVSQSECTWRIAVAEGNLIQLVIVDLQLEYHSKCRYDYIEISEGMNNRDSVRYCSSPYPQVIQSKSNVMNIRFRSDLTYSGRGFHLKYETLCNNKIHGFYGVIESPNFPEKYMHNLNCTWTIDAPKGNKINLTFSHFDLESDFNRKCKNDYLTVYEGREGSPQELLKKICSSNEIPPKIHSTLSQVFVNFITDSMLAYNGFRLEWVIDGCGGHLTKPADSFTSPGYPSSYPTDIECEWLIEIDYSHSIELTIHDINMEKQKGCYYDSLQIYSGVDEKAPLLIELCYSPKPLIYTSFGNTMFLKFHSDSLYSWRGFNISYKSVPITCGGRYTTDTGLIFSTNYPKNYPNKQNCKWLIQVDQSYVVNITFLDFDIEDTKNCTDDYVQIYDGPTTDSPLLGTHCRNDLPPSYVTTSNEMLIVMRSDSMLSAKGFQARYYKACGARILVENDGFIVPSKTYIDNPEINVNCTWILAAKNPADHVTVIFTHMEIYKSWIDDCSFDYVQIFEGEGLDGPSRGKWCEDDIPLPVTSNGNALTVHLYASMDFIDHVSFTYSALNSACGGTYTSYRGRIASPNYPNSYPLNSECIWILKNSPGNRISLTFSEFDLQQSENCDLDYLEIRENSGIGKLISISCGTNVDTVESSESLWIKFKSDGDDVGKGFVGEFNLLGGNEDLSGPMGRITSPLYPLPYKRRDTLSWRITVDYGWLIRIQITDIFIERLKYTCYPYLRIYDGYNNMAPILLQVCGFNIPDPLTSITNVVYIELATNSIRHDNWFDLNWIQIPKDADNVLNENVVIELPECNREVALLDSQNNSYEFTSPGWPDGYQDNLHCTWVFTSPPGTHLHMKILSMNLEESSNCVHDFVAVYSGNALITPDNAQLIQKLCLANSTSAKLVAGNVMTIKFETDSYVNKTGFVAYVYRDCGGKLEGPNGVIEINNTTSIRGTRFWQVACEWVVEVKPGRTIEVQITEMSIQQGPSWICTDNYLMLKNGGEATSPLLGVGKYCGNVKPQILETTGNRLYVKAFGVRTNVNFKLVYRQISTKCGGEFVLSNRNKKWEISTPNYPNIPHPYTECTWTAMASGKERISIHFIERFDLSYTLNCEKEYVEVRDGGTDSSKLFGRYCKDVPPSSMISTGNMLFVHFYTDIPEPKNGFKAVLTIGDICGGIIRGVSGIISSPNYPFYYPKNQTCTWHIIGPVDHTLKFSFMDIQLPGYKYCKDTNYLEIFEKLPGNVTNNLGTYCGSTIPEIIETASNEAIVTFSSENIVHAMYRGFSMNYIASQEVCGGELTALQGTIKSNGYPNIATRSKYCDWRIKLPKGYQVVVEIQDLDIMPLSGTRIVYSISFYNDFRFKSRIKVVGENSLAQQIRSSGNTMMIGYYSSAGYRGFKLRYYGAVPAPCGGVLTQVRGNLTGPKNLPFNESSYFCQWDLQAPQSLTNNDNNTGLTLSIMITGVIGGIYGQSYTKYCYNYQYISLTGAGMLCGNFSEPIYLRSPKLLNELTIVNGTFGKKMDFKLEYQWQPCGGILEGLMHVISTPTNISYPINCVWHANYPDNGEMIKFHLSRFHLGGCDRNYISIRDGGALSPQIAKFCGNVQPYNITSTSNELWIEYTAMEEPNDFEFILEPANNGCGGALRGYNREISSPKFPSQYPNNAECTWEITAENGNHIGLVFVDRFNLESSTNCEKDYLQIFQWIKETNETSNAEWQELGKICGRNTPQPFNATGNRMKVIFHSNEAIQGDGFRALWYQNCGGVFNVTSHHNIIVSPSYPNFYQPNLFCNYTLVAPEESFIIQFMEFQVEQSRKDCRFDNVTIKYTEKYSEKEKVWCGENKPPMLMTKDRAEIIFRTDRYIQRSGFLFKYYLNGCSRVITEPTEIKPLMQNEVYFGGITCLWEIRAPPDKNVVVRFEYFELEDSYRCMYDKVRVYEGTQLLDENKLGTLCGNLTGHLPVFKSNSSYMTVHFHADESFSYKGFSAKVLFVKNVEAGCGGFVNLTDIQSQSFKTQKGSTYDSLEDCHWRVIAPEGKNVKFTINSMDVKYAEYINASDECTGDYIEVRDGAGALAELVGRYCGNEPPLPIMSGSNALWIRFFSDGTLEGAGVSGTLEAVDALCGFAPSIVNNTKLVLASPNYPSNYEPGSKCRWILNGHDSGIEKIKIRFLNMDLAESDTCENDYVQITDTENRRYIEEGFGENFVWNGQTKEKYSSPNNFASTAAYKYCGNSLPHDYYSHSNMVEVSFKGSSPGHEGFKLEYSRASCDWNFTAEQGRILHAGIEDCSFTITAPEHHTISLYFNEFVMYDSTECTHTSLRIYDGGFDGKLMATLCSVEEPSPIFSTGNKLSLQSVSEWYSTYESYDITYTTTTSGRGCGGRIYNYAGSFTSPMYPNEYRENTLCVWDISVPRGLKISVEFPVLDIGPRDTCDYAYNSLRIYDVMSNGEQILATAFCGGDNSASYVSTNDKLSVQYTSTMNNIGTGWRAIFKAVED